MTRLKNIAPMVLSIDTRTVRPPPKQADPVYLTTEHRAWRTAVLKRAGWRCEAIVDSQRCSRAFPHRLFADHRVEIKDDGARLDVANGQALCGRCHSLKTNAAKLKRWTGGSR